MRALRATEIIRALRQGDGRPLSGAIRDGEYLGQLPLLLAVCQSAPRDWSPLCLVHGYPGHNRSTLLRAGALAYHPSCPGRDQTIQRVREIVRPSTRELRRIIISRLRQGDLRGAEIWASGEGLLTAVLQGGICPDDGDPDLSLFYRAAGYPELADDIDELLYPSGGES